MMSNLPVQPEESPDLNQPAAPGEGPLELPTPALPAQPQPSSPSRLCPLGYTRGVVQNGQTFTDLLLQHDVSYQALRSANPFLPTTRLSPGTVYCVPPAGGRCLCPGGSQSYVMGEYEDLTTLSELFSVSPGVFLALNTKLAPSDFTAGRVVCVP